MTEQEKTEQEPKQEKTEDEPKQEKREDPKPEGRAGTMREDSEPRAVKCPECRVSLDPDDLGSHRYLAHKVERRATPKREGSEDDDQDDGTGSRTPKRKDAAPKDESGSQSRRKPSSRWGKVRSSWGG